ncbi:MAG: hypothetical protein E7382_00550 [Clostridiales bacterium]|nr:hypothetical protein [Clostridiales bacterium]
MIFTYKNWDKFCALLQEKGVQSITANRLMTEKVCSYVILKHDVETNVKSAFKIAEIESKHGHRGVYYVQAYLLDEENNVELLRKMQDMGHEISYHYDVMDANGGDIALAIEDFEEKREKFEKNDFHLITLCQHGNPIVERKGYTSNRDFFRNEKVQGKFPMLTDVMVDFKEKAVGGTEYLYFSDAGRKFKLIFDPINNDVIPSDDKNIPFDNLTALYSYVEDLGANAIISMHPHRWVKSKFKYVVKTAIFKVIRAVAKVLSKIPFMKKFMSKYYHLAKKL